MREEKRPKNNYRNKNTRRKSSCEWRWNLKITCVIHFVDNIFGSWNFCLFSPCYCLFQKRKMFLDQVEKQKKELGKCRVCFVSLWYKWKVGNHILVSVVDLHDKIMILQQSPMLQENCYCFQCLLDLLFFVSVNVHIDSLLTKVKLVFQTIKCINVRLMWICWMP